jgi:hypothetical protein
MPQIDEPIAPRPKTAPESRKPKPAAADRAAGGVYSFTIDTGTGRVVTVESVESSGERRPLTADQKAELAKALEPMPLRRLVEQAFEAGIEFVLGDGAAGDTPETKEEGELSGLLLQKMIEGSKAGELVKTKALDRSVVDALIIHAAK